MSKGNTCECTTQLYGSNNETKWQDSIAAELEKQMKHEICKDLFHASKAKPTPGLKKIRFHSVYNFKHDGCCKSRLVADVHLTDTPLYSARSRVVSLKGS